MTTIQHRLAVQLIQTARNLAASLTDDAGGDGDYAALLTAMGETVDALRATAETISDLADALGSDLRSLAWNTTAEHTFTAANTLYTAASLFASSAADAAVGQAELARRRSRPS